VHIARVGALLATLAVLLVAPASSYGNSSSRASGSACSSTARLPRLFDGAKYRLIRTSAPLYRARRVVGEVVHERCATPNRPPCAAMDCIELREPVRVPVVRIRGVRASVAVAERAPSRTLYVRSLTCRNAGAARLVRCLTQASRAAPPHVGYAGTGRPNLWLQLTAGGPSTDSFVALAYIENRGRAPARDVVVSFAFATSVTVRSRTSTCWSLALCPLGVLFSGQSTTAFVQYAPGSPVFAPLGAVVTATGRDVDPRDNRAFTVPSIMRPPTGGRPPPPPPPR
jgi:hypothetical protein